MSRPVRSGIACGFWLVGIALIIPAGCNTEMNWPDTQTPQTARASIDDPPPGGELPDIQIADSNEVDIVEQVLEHRANYRKTLETLRQYYVEHGYNTKQKWAEAELADLRRIKPYKYIMSAEIPVSRLTPRYSIPEADSMYQQGLDLMRKGGHGVPALYNRQYMRQALDVFTDLIKRYPESDKIDDAAFCNGEILKEYFNNCELLAVRWYQRCREWDPRSPHPALFQAAVLYDYRMHDRAKALELYHRVLEEETVNPSNTSFASRRIYELTEGMSQLERPRNPVGSMNYPSSSGLGSTGSGPRVETRPPTSEPVVVPMQSNPAQSSPVQSSPAPLNNRATTTIPMYEAPQSNASEPMYRSSPPQQRSSQPYVSPPANQRRNTYGGGDVEVVPTEPYRRPQSGNATDPNRPMVPVVNLGPDTDE